MSALNGSRLESLTVERPMPAQQMDARPPAFPEVRSQSVWAGFPQRDQLGQGYIILENTGRHRIFGALYYPPPSSSLLTAFEDR